MRNCRASCEDSITRASWTRTYRFVVMKHCGVDPDERPHGVYLFYSTVKPAVVGGISGSHTAMKSANKAVEQLYELSKFRRSGGKLTS